MVTVRKINIDDAVWRKMEVFIQTVVVALLLSVAAVWLLHTPWMGSSGPINDCEAVLLILSTPNARIKRDAIRESWLAELTQQQPPFVFKHAFVLGRRSSTSDTGTDGGPVPSQAQEEQRAGEREGDLLVLPFVDNYWNLTTKVSLAFTSSFVSRSRCRIVVKIDDDVYVRVRRFVAMVRRLPSFELFGGYVFDQRKRVMRVVRREQEPTNKFSFTRAELPQDLFAPYARYVRQLASTCVVSALPDVATLSPYPSRRSGPIYFMSLSVAARLPPLGSVANGTGDPLARLEDVYVGKLVASMAPPVAFWHVPKVRLGKSVGCGCPPTAPLTRPQIILEATDPRAPELIALHNVRVPGTMLHGRATFNVQKSLIID